MTPKEKARELVHKMNFSHPEHEMYVAKQCALIAVDEAILSNHPEEWDIQFHLFWEQVRVEIKLL